MLNGHALTVHGVRALTSTSFPTALEELDLQATALGPSAVQLLADWPTSAHLRRPDLTGNNIGNDGAHALTASPHLSAGLLLLVGDCGIGPTGLATLTERFPRLVSLTPAPAP
jgi:hypothetical protein